MDSMFERNSGIKRFIETCEDHADTIVRKTRKYLPHIARLCLIATFLEDGIRLITQFSDQIEYISSVWGAPTFLSFIFIFINIFTQLIGSGFILMRVRVNQGVFLLLFTVLIQTIGYQIWRDTFLMRNLSLCGSLMLLLAETNEEKKSLLAGLPSAGDDSNKQYMLLGGRVLVVLMFLTMIHFNGSSFYVIQSIANLILILLVAVGFKTKLCALLLVTWLTIMNFTYNNFWTARYDASLWDFLKYDFFQTWSVIGGLALIVAYGPGGVSIDDYKKKW